MNKENYKDLSLQLTMKYVEQNNLMHNSFNDMPERIKRFFEVYDKIYKELNEQRSL